MPFCVVKKPLTKLARLCRNWKFAIVSPQVSLFENWPKVEMPKSLWLTEFATKEETIWKLQRVGFHSLPGKMGPFEAFSCVVNFSQLHTMKSTILCSTKWVSKFKSRFLFEKWKIENRWINFQPTKIESCSNIRKIGCVLVKPASHWVK